MSKSSLEQAGAETGISAAGRIRSQRQVEIEQRDAQLLKLGAGGASAEWPQQREQSERGVSAVPAVGRAVDRSCCVDEMIHIPWRVSAKSELSEIREAD